MTGTAATEHGIIRNITFQSCTAEVLVGNVEEHGNIKVTSVMSIRSREEGKGHAKGCILAIENLALRNGSHEIWFPTVISARLDHLLRERGYIRCSFGIHPMLNEEVFGFKKILRVKA